MRRSLLLTRRSIGVCGAVLRYCLYLPILLLFNCVGSDALYDPPGGRGFWARQSDITTGASSFYRVTSEYVASSKNSIVYMESKNPVPKSSIDGLIAAYENNIVPIEHVWYRTPMDIDNNGKVIFLLLDIQDGYQPGGGYIAGYFDPYNEYSNDSDNNSNSNQADMVYLDTYPSDVTKPSFFATLAHEYQHLLQFSKLTLENLPSAEPLWVDEGMAEATADATGFGPQIGRANNFRGSLLDGTSLIKTPDAFLLDNYAASYIYFRFIYDSYGIGGLSAIFRDDLTDVAGVDDAIQLVDSGLTDSTICTNTAALSSPHFACSYRFMWAAMINGSLGDSPTGAGIRYNSDANANITYLGSSSIYSYKLNTSNQQYTQQLSSSLSVGSFGPISSKITGAMNAYAPLLLKINNATSPTPPDFQICSGCDLTMVIGNSYYVVYNHDTSTTNTHAATVIDSISGTENGSESNGTPQSLPTVDAVTGAVPLEERKLHWHFSISPRMREILQLPQN